MIYGIVGSTSGYLGVAWVTNRTKKINRIKIEGTEPNKLNDFK